MPCCRSRSSADGLEASGVGLRASGFGIWALGFGFWVLGFDWRLSWLFAAALSSGLSLITLTVIMFFAGIALIYVLVSRGPSIPDDATLVLRPGGALPETVPDDVVGQLLARDTMTVRGFVEGLDKAKRDPRIKAVLLMPSSVVSPYWAKLQELRDAVIDFKKSGKTVIAFLEYGGDREYYLASAADKVYLLPTSSLDLTGVASYEIFLRGTLDKIGAVPDYLHVGEYKTAVNQMTEKGFTPAHREMSESLNRDMYDQLIRGIAEARKKSEPEVRALIDQGPFTPEDALRHGFVDELAYEDQLDDRVPALRSGSRETRRVEGSDYQRIRRGIRRPAAAVAHRGDLRRRRDHLRPERLRSAERRGGRLGLARRADPRGARRRDREGDHPARGQPRRIVGGVGCDLEGVDDHARQEPVAPADRVDVRPRGVGRLLHFVAGAGHRRAAGHAHRLDRRLRGQDRARRDAEQRWG